MQYRLSTQFRVDASGRRLPDDVGPTIDDAARHYGARDYAAAAQVCDAILARQPSHFDALHLRGVLYQEAQKSEEALAHLRRAEQLRADDPQLQCNIGNALHALKRHAEAEQAFRRSLALRPDDFDAWNNLGNALAGDKRHEAAIACFHQALALRQNAPPALYNLGRSLSALGRLDEAVEYLRATFAHLEPGTDAQRLIDLHIALSEALVQQCHYEEALALLRSAPAAIADAPAMQWNASLTLLMLGDYREGWRKYECRFLVPDHDPPRDGAAPLDLTEVAGQRVLVFPEQGRGDMIQFARYLPLLAERGARVLVEMYADLKPLFETIDGVAQVVTPEEAAPEHERLTALLSLPSAFGTTLDNIPARVPYLRVPEAYAMRWAELLRGQAGPRIGIAWCGSPQSAPRSAMPLPLLEPLLEAPGYEFHCLHKEISPDDRGWLAAHGSVTRHSGQLNDFADTAALIARMDLVISIDTAVAHLAGALGKPVWIMLPFGPDWRWLRERDDSPWYPTARLFRQPRRGAWETVVQRVAEALSVGW